MIDGGEPLGLERRRDPEAAGRPSRRAVFPQRPIRVRLTKRLELRGGRPARAHELHFVEHPLGVLVQKSELHRPDCTGRGIAAHQRAAQQHVLGAHEHGRAFRRLQPAVGVHPAHEHVHVLEASGGGLGRPLQPRACQTSPLTDVRGLLDERPHGQAPDQTAGRGVGAPQPVRRPRERHGGRLSRSSRRNQDLRPRISRERELPPVGGLFFAERGSIDGCAVQAMTPDGTSPKA